MGQQTQQSERERRIMRERQTGEAKLSSAEAGSLLRKIREAYLRQKQEEAS